MTVLVCGGRHFNNYKQLEEILNTLHLTSDDLIVSGGYVGTDTLAELYAIRHNIPKKIFYAEWRKYGNSAGIIRNNKMIDYIKNFTSCVVAFTSKNTEETQHTIQQAIKNNIPVMEITYDSEK